MFSVNSVSAGIHFTESFTSTSFSPTAYTDGTDILGSGTWDYMQIKAEISANSYGATGGAARLNKNITTTGSYLICPSVNTIGTITFWYRELNTGGGTITIQKSVDGGTFTTIGSQTFSGTTYNQYSLTINDLSSNIRIKILSLNNPGYLIIDEVTITDYAIGPTLTVSPTDLSGFNYIFGSGPSASQTYILSGNNLTGFPGDITVTAPLNFEISLDDQSFSSGVNVPYTSASLTPTFVYVRLKSGLAVNSYNGEIIANAGGGATSVNVICNGYVSDIPPASLTVSTSTLSGFTYLIGSGPSVSQSYDINGVGLTGYPGNITITSPANYEVSTDNLTFSSVLNIPFTSDVLAPATIYVRLKTGLAINTYNSEIITNEGGGASTVNVTCNGSVTDVLIPALTTNVSSLSGFTYFEGSGPSATQLYNLTGSNLGGYPGDITVTAPANYEVSADNNTFLPSLNIPFTSPTLTSTPVYVRLKSGLTVGFYDSEIITNAGSGTSVDVTCNGEVKENSISCASDLFISEYHEPSAGNNKGVEVYNGTGADVDLSNYYIGVISNGGTDVETSIALSGTLGDKQTACIYNDTDTDPNFRLKGDINIPWGSATWNGDDAVYLLKGGATASYIIDAIGDLPPVTDPGTEFVSNGVSTLNTCLIRKDTVSSPVTTWLGSDWIAVTAGTYSDWGVHTIDCPTNVNANKVPAEIELYPNPNIGSFSIKLPENSEVSCIRIINVFGAVVYENKRIESSYNLDLESGVYILQMQGNKEKITKKFVVY